MAGVSDVGQNLCMALALWNGRDPILKERMFGLTGPAGQPRRGRQGVLVVPRRPAQPRVAALALPLPAVRVPVCRPGGRERPARPEPARVRAAGHRRRSTRTATGWSTSSTPRPTRTTCSWRSASPTPAPRRRRCTCCPTCGSATPGPGTSAPHGPRCGPPAPTGSRWTTRGSASWPGSSTPARTASRPDLLFCENDTNLRAALRLRRDSPAYPKDGINDHVVAGAPTVNPDRVGTKCAAWYRLDRGTGRDAGGAGPPAPAVVVARRSAPPSTTVLAQRRSEADEFYAEVIPAVRRRRRAPRGPPGVRRDDLGQAVLPLRREALAGRRPDPAAATAGTPQRAATPAGSTSTPATSCRCPIPGSTRGSRPGTWPSTPSPWRTSTRRSPSTSCSRCAASGSRTPTARSRRTSGPSATPTRRCTPGRPCTCGTSTAAATPTSSARLMPKLLMNFTWWVNRMDPEGDHLFAGGFLGLDNISAIDRSHLPAGRTPRAGRRHQLDGVLLADPAGDRADPGREGRRLDRHRGEVHRALRADRRRHALPGALGRAGRLLLRRLPRQPTATTVPIKVRSIVGVLPLHGRWSSLGPDLLATLGTLRKRFAGFLGHDEPGAPGRRPRAGRPGPRTATPSPSGVVPPGSGAPRPGPGVRRGRVPLPARAAGAVEVPRGTPAVGRARRDRAVSVDYEPGRVRAPACSAATPTGADRCGCRSTTSCCATSSATPGRSATRPRSSTRPAAANRSRWRRAPRTSGGGCLAVPQGA